MQAYKRPTKEQVRQWLADRAKAHAPLPSLEAVRQDVGWLVAQTKRVLS